LGLKIGILEKSSSCNKGPIGGLRKRLGFDLCARSRSKGLVIALIKD
ncbi:hypothetical protein A2U01_0033909, partial [Trifolium medium]|nr:hypothetical protein [Trifolium medium]